MYAIDRIGPAATDIRMNTNATRRVVIDVTKDLPARARRLSPEAIANVFGGCVQLGKVCSPNGATCCYGTCQLYKPYPNWPGAWYCDISGGGGE
jgi:hypothetical protein